MSTAAPALAPNPKDPLATKLSAPVGMGKKNLAADVLTLQRRLNALHEEHYLDNNKWTPLDENGVLTSVTLSTLTALEALYFSPPLKGYVEPGDRLDKFTLDLACGPLDVKDSLYGLAAHMVVDGKDKFQRNAKTGQMEFASGNIRSYLPDLYAALEEQNLTDSNMLLIAFATIAAENSTFMPRDEDVDHSNTTFSRDPVTRKIAPHVPPFNKYDQRTDIGNLKSPDGDTFHGRGFIQLTGREGYQRYGRKLGIDLEKNPEKAADPIVSDKIFARWLKDKESTFRKALAANNLESIRHLVNGGENGMKDFRTAMSAGRTYLHLTKAIPKARTAARKHAQKTR